MERCSNPQDFLVNNERKLCFVNQFAINNNIWNQKCAHDALVIGYNMVYLDGPPIFGLLSFYLFLDGPKIKE
jgi:hypothetical protein